MSSNNQLGAFRSTAAASGNEPSASSGNLDSEVDLGNEFAPLNKFIDRIIDSKRSLEEAQDQHMEITSKSTKETVAKKSREVNQLVRDALGACSEYDQKVKARFQEKKLTREEGEARLRECSRIRSKIVDLSKITYKSQRDHREDFTRKVARQVNEKMDSDHHDRKSQEETQQIAQALIRTNRERMLFRLSVLELEDAVAERQAVDEIEQSVQELLQIMEEYRTALGEQTQLVLHAEENVIVAEKNVKKAEKQLRKAAESSSCCCVVQ